MTERDSNGRFVKGHSGGPGRPAKERSERYYEIAISACTYDDWREIWKKAVEQAKRGNPTARKFLADYLLGTPVRRTEISGPDGGPIEMDNVGLTDEERAGRIMALVDAAREKRARGAP